MKIDNNTRFPYPVLCDFTEDYEDCNFTTEFEIEENFKEGKILIHFNNDITEKTILNFVQEKKIKSGFFVTCLDTFFNRLETVDINQKSFTLRSAEVDGRVTIRPIIWSDKLVDGFSSPNLHPEFRDSYKKISSGQLIAIGDEFSFHAGHEKLTPLESIFSLGKDNEVPDGQIRVQVDDDKIKILASDKTYSSIHELRHGPSGKAVLLNSIFLPALMEVLSILKNPDESIKEKRWYRAINAKCEHLGINPENGEILQDAQILFKSPFLKIQKQSSEIMS